MVFKGFRGFSGRDEVRVNRSFQGKRSQGEVIRGDGTNPSGELLNKHAQICLLILLASSLGVTALIPTVVSLLCAACVFAPGAELALWLIYSLCRLFRSPWSLLGGTDGRQRKPFGPSSGGGAFR
jgi:hypothetical protein